MYCNNPLLSVLSMDDCACVTPVAEGNSDEEAAFYILHGAKRNALNKSFRNCKVQYKEKRSYEPAYNNFSVL